MATPAQEDVRAYIQERRKHRARRVGQVSGATAAVMSDKENAVDAVSYTHLTLPTIYSV